jgi:hypothetical protein
MYLPLRRITSIKKAKTVPQPLPGRFQNLQSVQRAYHVLQQIPSDKTVFGLPEAPFFLMVLFAKK